jgi:hypothetical protein
VLDSPADDLNAEDLAWLYAAAETDRSPVAAGSPEAPAAVRNAC